MNLRDVQFKVRAKALDFKAVARLVCSPAFERAWEVATAADRLAASVNAGLGNRDALRGWMMRLLSTFDDEKGIRELREMAKQQGVPYYHHLNKAELLEALKQC